MQVRKQPGSHGAMAVGSLHASAERPTPNYSPTVYQPAMAVRMDATSCCSHTELLHRERLGSPIRQVREQLGSQGAMAAGSLHASAEHLLQTTLM